MTKPAALTEPHVHLHALRAQPQGSTLEVREKKDDEGGGDKNTAGLIELRTSPAVHRTMTSSSPLRSYVVRNSQRSPSAH